MTDGTTEHSQTPGWGIDWSSAPVRRKYFALAIILALCNSLGVLIGIGSVSAMLGPQEYGALVAGPVAVGAITALYAIVFFWLRPQIGNEDDFGSVVATASRIDTGWFSAWITVIVFLPLLITVPILYFFDLKPVSGIYALLFGNLLVANLSPFAVMALRGPEAPSLRTSTKNDEFRHAKRTETGMLIAAFAIFFMALALVGALLVHFTSKFA